MRRQTAVGLLAFFGLVVSALPVFGRNFRYDYVFYEGDNRVIPVPRSYITTRTIRFIGEEYGDFRGARDLFIDDNDILYIADTEKNRILKLDREGTVLNVFTGDEKGFKKPGGVFVDRFGDIFVADTENSRLVHLSADGEMIEEFGEPRSGILGEYFTYYPHKIFISPTGFIYVIRGETIMILDAYNNFRGYLGQTDVGFSFTDWLVNLVASEEQKEIIANRYAARYTNLLVDSDGIIYATSLDETYGQLKKLNAIGENIYKEQFYGEIDVSDAGQARLPQFIDLSLSSKGIITALEYNQKKLFQYDQEGNLVVVFGGEGTTKGRFSQPTSIALDSDDRLYVLDSTSIQIMEPTYFISTVHSAIYEYSQGRYQEALTLWNEVQRIDENYRLAASGVAKALHKQELYDEALNQYRSAENVSGYSTSYVEFRHERFRRYFTVVVLVLVAVIFLVSRVVIITYRAATKILDDASYRVRRMP